MKNKILITGATGFIGSSLIPLLRDYKVYALVRNISGRYLLGEGASLIFSDLCDFVSIKNIIKQLKPHIVVHLGAISAVSYSYDHPNEILETNFLAAVNLAESCLKDNPNLKKFIFASTSETYGNQEQFPIKETARLNPNSPYSVSKVAAEKYLNYMNKAYDFPVIIMRPFNTYGRSNSSHFLVERTITQMLKGKDVYLGNPEPIRDFLYLSDHLHAYICAIEKEEALHQIFNFCTGKDYSIKDTVNLIKDAIGFKGDIYWNTIPARPYDIKRLKGSYAKANKVLNWSPKYNLEDGLKKTIKIWRKKYGTT